MGTDASKSGMPGVTYAYYEPTTHHNIPQVFWDFLNQSGPVIENGQTVHPPADRALVLCQRLPVSDAYWAR